MFYYIRHGEKLYNNGKGIPRLDPAIKSVNMDLKNFLPKNPSFILSSPFRRCIETAKILFPHREIYCKLEYREYLGHWKDIKEEDFEKETIENIKKCTSLNSDLETLFTLFSEETIPSFKKRSCDSIKEILSSYDDSYIIVTHGFFLTELYKFLLKTPWINITLFYNDPVDGFKVEIIND